MSTPPAKGTPEYRLWVAALDVAVWAPLEQGIAARAQVPWRLIHELREIFEELNIDWRATKAENDEWRDKRRREEEEERKKGLS
jgi:hypothetical protein